MHSGGARKGKSDVPHAQALSVLGGGKSMPAFPFLESAAEGVIYFAGASWLDITRFGKRGVVLPDPGFHHGYGAARRCADRPLTVVPYLKIVVNQPDSHRNWCNQHQQRPRTDVLFLDGVYDQSDATFNYPTSSGYRVNTYQITRHHFASILFHKYVRDPGIWTINTA